MLTYAQLNTKANQVAWHLQSIGIGIEDVVAVSLEKSNLFVVSILAIWKANAAYLPLDTPMPGKRMNFMISDARARCVITTRTLAEAKAFDTSLSMLILVDDLEVIHTLKSFPSISPPRSVNSHNLAYIIYTSGTSGNPKGVGITHANIIHLVNDIRQSREITCNDRVMVFSPFCFDATIRDISGALLNGASLYIPREEEVLPGNLVATLQAQKITNVAVTPSVLHLCQPQSLPFLKTIVTVGEQLSKDVIRT
jgi:non-ribosomal peptide synthetase component F